ncbi:MAG: phosphoglycerate dehydrogenase [Planctomycetota bacterium]|jgi:D-3-phosphoglycerate dehydrogenase
MTRLNILVADDLGEEGMELLRQAGEVTLRTGMDEAQLREALRNQHALVVRSATKVTAPSLEFADKLAVIGRAGIGVDNIDLEAATERGIVVMNTPEAGAVTTGELAIALLTSMARKIPAADAAIKAGRWEKKQFTGVELKDKILGVLGLGRIGQVVASRGQGLAMQVIAHDPFVPQDRAPEGVRMVEFDELLSTCDFLSVHVPLSDKTRGLLDHEQLGKMKQGAYLVHAARGGIVDEDALCDLLESKHLAGAALDVFCVEPLPEDHRLRHLDQVVLTPHIGASTAEAKSGVSRDIANQVALCLQTGVAINGINVPRIAPASAASVCPYLDLAHNLAALLAQVHQGELQSVRVTLQGGLPASASQPLTVAALVGLLQGKVEGPVTPVNANRIAKAQGIRVHTETSSMKRDFMNLMRVEAVFAEERHFVTGTVLGHRHGRMVEFDDYFLDAIPEGPLLVTIHEDVPGVLGRIGSILGAREINIARMQLGTPSSGEPRALGIWNLDRSLDTDCLDEILALDPILQAHFVD